VDNNSANSSQKLLEALVKFKRVHGHEMPPIDGLNHGEILVLFAIKKAATSDMEGIKVSEISKRMMVATPTTTQVVNKLVAGGYVEKRADEKDARAVRISLTTKGEEIILKAHDCFHNMLSGLVNHLGEEKTATLTNLLNEAYDYFCEQKKKS